MGRSTCVRRASARPSRLQSQRATVRPKEGSRSPREAGHRIHQRVQSPAEATRLVERAEDLPHHAPTTAARSRNGRTEIDHRRRLRQHRPQPRPGQRRTTAGLQPRSLGPRKQVAPHTRWGVWRRRPPGTIWLRPPNHGRRAEHRHRPLSTVRVTEHRRGPTKTRLESPSPLHHPWLRE